MAVASARPQRRRVTPWVVWLVVLGLLLASGALLPSCGASGRASPIGATTLRNGGGR